MTDHDPLTVQCPDCFAPALQPCRMGASTDARYHATRTTVARVVDADEGTCTLCGRRLLRATDPDDAWHPPDVLAERTCPPRPSVDPWDAEGWSAFLTTYPQGEGHPGIACFVPSSEVAKREAASLTEAGRRLASERDDLIAAGVDPADLLVPGPPVPPCPECAQGKHQNCVGLSVHPVTDDLVQCPCFHPDWTL